MQQYSVRAYDANKTLHEFSRRMPSERDLRVQLAKDGLVIGVVKLVEGDIQDVDPAFAETKAMFIEQLGFFKKHSVQSDVVVTSLRNMFGTQRISLMERAKIVLSRVTRGNRRSMRSALLEVIEAIPTSATFAEAMEKAPDVFSSDEITLLMISENRGSQMETFASIANQLHRDASVNNKVNVALRYPKVLLLGVVGSAFIYFSTMLPVLRKFYADQHEPLIFPLNWMIALSDFFAVPLYGAISVGVLLAIATFFAYQVRTNPELQYRLDIASMNIPLFGRMTKDKRLVRMFYSLKLMTENGREREALEAAVGTARGPVFREALKRSAKRYATGSSGSGFADALSGETHLFDHVIVETLRTRERNASLPETYQNLIDMLIARIDLEIQAMPKMIESLVGLVFACMIGFMAYAMIVPSSYAVAHVH
jgi:type II secretory pathway component PulF